ncbi:MAG: radical SAM protein [Spirochaetes bacterium]|nr:radical SAM protein [Spirochaetota bacterium]
MKDQNKPRLIFWELTKRCNLNCIHCRAEAENILFENELSTEQIFSIIDDIVSYTNPILVLTGGEPLYREDIFEISGYASDKNIRLALATNGTLIDKDTAKKISESGIQRVSISIDGSSAQSHDSFRGIPGSYDKVLQAASYLYDSGVEFQFNTTITRRNVNEIEDIIKLAEKMHSKALHIFMLVPVGCGVEIAETEMLPADKYEEVLSWLYDRMKQTSMEFKATCAPPYYRIIRQKAKLEGRKINFETDGMTAITRGCLAGTGVCFISHTGDVQPCGYLPLSAGNVIKNSFKEIWEKSELFNNLRDLSKLKGKCGICEYKTYCAGCRARAYYQTGDYMEEEPYCLHVPARQKTLNIE